jgi:hypothetical protein
MSRERVKRNEPCPCGAKQKYKHCCYGKVDWNEIDRKQLDWRPYLSTRGRNLAFINRIGEALNLDHIGQSQQEYKAAFTASAVRSIHEAIIDLWPRNLNLVAALQRTATDVSGLYIGDYAHEYILRGFVRHSIYANKILLIDPFVYPYSVRDEFNPILNPGQYRTQTLKNVNLWFSLVPWIEAGIVEIIRTPCDFDPKLFWDSMEREERKLREHPELQSAVAATIDQLQQRHIEKFAFQDLLLAAPDEYLERVFRDYKEANPTNPVTFDQFLSYIRQERANAPNFLEPLGPNSSQLSIVSTGASYEVASMVANVTKSYLVTDLLAKWREIELDRDSHSPENKVWTPFAKSIQEARLKYLNNLELKHALRLRQEGRLESMRKFLHGVWSTSRTERAFDEANALLLAEELTEQVRRAENEWQQIDADLLKQLGSNLPIVAISSLIASGHGNFLPWAVAAAGTYAVVSSTIQRRLFFDRFPAAFFMKID